MSILETYKVKVLTGDVEQAGTGANVFLQMFGNDGKSKRLRLKGNFSRDSLVKLTITMQTLGSLKKIKIWHDNSGSSPNWFLKSVEIVAMTSKESWKFPCERWLAKDGTRDETSLTLSLGRIHKYTDDLTIGKI